MQFRLEEESSNEEFDLLIAEKDSKIDELCE